MTSAGPRTNRLTPAETTPVWVCRVRKVEGRHTRSQCPAEIEHDLVVDSLPGSQAVPLKPGGVHQVAQAITKRP